MLLWGADALFDGDGAELGDRMRAGHFRIGENLDVILMEGIGEVFINTVYLKVNDTSGRDTGVFIMPFL